MKKIYGSYCNEHGKNFFISEIVDPSESEIFECVDVVTSNLEGQLTFELIDPHDIGPNNLKLYSDCGNYLVMQLNYLEDGDSEVLNIPNNYALEEMVEILGDFYSNRMITNDADFVCQIFLEFSRMDDSSRLLQ